jgi:hypothetical protein
MEKLSGLIFAAPNAVHLVVQAYLDDFFSSTLSCLKDHHYHQRFYCGEFSHPWDNKDETGILC